MTHVYELDGNQMQTPVQAHTYLKQILEFPDYYGMNADALFDCLTEDSRERLIFLYFAGKIHSGILTVFEEASQENPFLTIIESDEENSLS